MLMTRLYANIKVGVKQEDMQRLQIFRGPNGSGKSANIEAITLLTNRAVSDLRGRAEAKEAAAVRVIKTLGTQGPIVIEAAFDDGQVASATAGEGKTSSLCGLFNEVTDLNALVDSWISGSVEANMLAFLRFVAVYGEPEWDAAIESVVAQYKVAKNVIDNAAEVFALPGLSVLLSIYEMVERTAKAAYLAEKADDNLYEVLKSQGLPYTAAYAELENKRKENTAAKGKVNAVYANVCKAASAMTLRFDDYAECTGIFFEKMTERFGAIVTHPALPDSMVFGKEMGYPCVSAVRTDGTAIPAFHGSQGEWARLYCSLVAAHLIHAHACRTGTPAPYVRYIFSDRGYDAGFIRRLIADFALNDGWIPLQAFLCVAVGDD